MAMCDDRVAFSKRGMAMSPESENPYLSEHVRKADFAATVEILTLAIHAAGLKIFAVIDHAAAAATAGLRMPGTVVILYGHPSNGTPLMRIAPSAALDLPLRVLIRDDGGGRTLVAFHPIVATLVAAGVPEEMARRLEPAQKLLIGALQQQP